MLNVPTVFREKGFRFLFYSNEGREPCHVHVIGRDGEAKIWIPGCEIARVFGLAPKDIAEILGIVKEKRKKIEEKWHEFFQSGK